MKVTVALGVALAALTVAAASAQSNSRHVIVRGGGSDIEIDANDDGWITRPEATSGFERIFADLDSNDDGKLDDADRRAHRIRVDGPDVRVLEGGNGRRIRVISRDGEDVEVDEAAIEREVERAMEEAEHIAEKRSGEAERALTSLADSMRASGRRVETAVRHGPAGPQLDEAARISAGEFWPGAHLGLTQRESEVLALLVSGHSNKGVAAKLVVSEDTVKTHIRGLYRKLGVQDRAGAIAVALREGLFH